MKTVAIVDYGLGNLFNVERAIASVGALPSITSREQELRGADGVVLPGVGAFGTGMTNLHHRGLVEVLRQISQEGKPLLGICLGMQLLMDESEEFGRWEGIGLVPGRVVRFMPTSAEPAKIPQVGWNRLEQPASRNGAGWERTLLDGVGPGAYVYFVHSYCVETQRDTDSLAETWYGGQRFCSVLTRGNVMGCQFHPEKSADAGLTLLRNFVRMLDR